ncbi:MAG: M48 family metallopeptidase [Rugosibacter sp.]|nr:M48 family metallopeptidase [Rugosibacter sp.]
MRTHLTIALLLVVSASLFGCAAPGTQRVSVSDSAVKIEERKQMEIVAEEIMAEQVRLADVSWLLQTKGRAICRDDVRPILGISTMSKPNDAMGEIYAEKFGIKDGITVFHVITGSPSDSAGIKRGDILAKINDRNVEKGKPIEELFGAWEQGRSVRMTLERQGKPVTATLTPLVACKYAVGLSPEQIINAFADGNRVMIARGMMSFAKTDNELALVVSHEIAHNSMKHIDAKKQNMWLGLLADIAFVLATKGQAQSPGFAGAGASAYSQEFEAEADYVGLYLMANAGLPITDAPKFWRRMAAAHPQNIKTNHSASHPSTSYRMVALEETVNEIQGKISCGEPLIPNMKEGKLFIPASK